LKRETKEDVYLIG